MLSNRRFYVELNNERSRWRKQKNGLPQGSVLSPILFNIYTNDQPIHDGTRNLIYADDLCVTSQYYSFTEVETTIRDVLEDLTQYYRSNSLRANPDKTQVTAFHLRNKDSNRSLKVEWNRTKLENTPHPKYLGVTLDRTLSYKEHMHNTKMKVATRNNLPKKVAQFEIGSKRKYHKNNSIVITQHQSGRDQILNPELNRSVTGCLKPTNVEDLYLLAGIAPPDNRRDVCARMEETKQETNEAHSLYGQNPTQRRLESRNCFLRSVKPADFPPKVIRCSAWLRRLQAIPHRATVNIYESLAK